MSKISCEIIKDLLPLYHDEVCSDDSKIMVEEHIAECSSCQNELAKIKADIKISQATLDQNRSDGNAIKNIAAFWSRSKVKAFVKGLIIATVVCGVIFLGYVGLFQWTIMPVSTDVVKITDVCQLADGRIAYHVELTDGYNLNYLKFEMDENGNFYEIPYRPIIKTKATANIGLQNMYDVFDVVEYSAYKDRYGNDAEIKAFYYGSPEDNILIWQKGMDLPAASAKVEAEFMTNNELDNK